MEIEIDDFFDQTIKCPFCSEYIEIYLEICDEQCTLYPIIECKCGKKLQCSPRVVWDIEESKE